MNDLSMTFLKIFKPDQDHHRRPPALCPPIVLLKITVSTIAKQLIQ